MTGEFIAAMLGAAVVAHVLWRLVVYMRRPKEVLLTRDRFWEEINQIRSEMRKERWRIDRLVEALGMEEIHIHSHQEIRKKTP